jgi:hypothetical protein
MVRVSFQATIWEVKDACSEYCMLWRLRPWLAKIWLSACMQIIYLVYDIQLHTKQLRVYLEKDENYKNFK